MTLSSSKVCALPDFEDPELKGWIREVFGHELQRFGPSFPAGVEYRKHWEIAMTVMTLSREGVLDREAEILGVGAGNEPTSFWLTNHARRVFATDLYAGSGIWAESADLSMLVNPEIHWPFAWNPGRLVVQHMDARDLRYDSGSFDAIFSSSSLEHFGDRSDVMRAISEMHRVLKPGGVLCLSTEMRLDGPGPGLPGILMFSEQDLRELVIDNGPWEPLEPLDSTVGRDTMLTVQDFADLGHDLVRHVAQEGHIVFHRLQWTKYPHIVLRQDERWWTSVHLALRRAA